MPGCPSCGRDFAGGERFCPVDGTRLPAATAEAPDPLIGTTLDGRYRVVAKLGQGGMGTVYRATHTMTGKSVAVKVLRPALARDETAARRFQREARNASRIDHPSCIHVTDFARDRAGGSLFLAMEYLEGETLGDVLRRELTLLPPRVVAIARQVVAALGHAHDLGIIHRDLKPDNIFLGPGDQVKVLDFGLAKALTEEGDTSTLTALGTVFGTPDYMSPEQAAGRPLDACSDLYSLGIVLYHMLTGQLPFQAASFIALLTKHLTEAPVPPALRRPDLAIPAELDALVMHLLEKEPSARPDAQTVLATLDAPAADNAERKRIANLPTEDLVAQPEPRGSAPATIPPLSRPRRNVFAWVAAPILVGAAVVVVLAVRRPGGDETRPTVVAAKTPEERPDRRAPAEAKPVAGETAPVEEAKAATEAVATGPGPDAGLPRAAVNDVSDVAPKPKPKPTRRELAADELREAERFRKTGNRIKELFHLQEAVRLDPGNSTARLRLATALIDSGQAELACKTLAPIARNARAKAIAANAGCAE